MGRSAIAVLVGATLVCAFPASAAATAPGRNGKIAFSHYDGGPRQIHVINPDGTGEAQLPFSSFAEDEPAWSPMGDLLAFRCFEDNGGDGICKGRADGSGTQLVGAECCTNSSPTWSADGTDIAWTAWSGAHFTEPYVWRMDADGSDHISLRVGSGTDWSPDTADPRIAYQQAGAGGLLQIAVMEADNSFSETLTATGDNISPSWSPDGTIAFTSYRDGNAEIYVTDAHGGVQTRLTNNSASDTDPEFSPNGAQIVFASNRDGDQHLYVMNADGTGVTQLTSEPGSADAHPDWQALPEGYPRPQGATPLRVSLVPAFDPCTAPNRTHGPPLAFGSCNPPTTPNRYATLGLQSRGDVRLDVVAQTPPATGWDAHVSAKVTDVKRIFDSADALGALDLTLVPQITDDANGALELLNGTTVKPGYYDNPLHVDVPCTATADPAVGSTCSVQTTFSALTGLSGERAVVELDQVTVYDGGDDGYTDTRDDNTPLAVQGVFVP